MTRTTQALPADWVSLDYFTPNRGDSVRSYRLAKRYNDLLDVDAGIRLAQTMKKHSRLKWRQLIRIDYLWFSVPPTERFFLANSRGFFVHYGLPKTASILLNLFSVDWQVRNFGFVLSKPLSRRGIPGLIRTGKGRDESEASAACGSGVFRLH